MSEFSPIEFHKIQAPPDAAFTCARCTDCCRNFTVGLSSAEAERLSGLYPSAVEPVEDHDPAGVRFRLKHAPDGACVLLDGNACRVHADHGEAAKPAVCRRFPYFLFERGEKAFLHLSRFCPTVYNARGATGEALLRAASENGGQSKPIRTGEIRIAGRVGMTEESYREFETELLALLSDDRWSLDDALGGGLILVHKFIAESPHSPAAPLDRDPINLVMSWIAGRSPSFPLYKYVMASVITTIERSPQAMPGLAAKARRKIEDLTRFRRILFWSGTLALRTLRVVVPMRGMYGIGWPRRDTPDLTPVRSLISSHIRRGILLEARDVEWAYHLLLGAYAAIKFYARASASSAERDRLIPSDIRAAVRIVEENLLLHRSLIGRPLDERYVTTVFRKFLFHPSYPGSMIYSS